MGWTRIQLRLTSLLLSGVVMYSFVLTKLSACRGWYFLEEVAGCKVISFSWPLSCEYCRRIDMIQELEAIANLSIPKDLSSEEANKYLIDACLKFDVKCPPPQTTTRLLDKVYHWYFCMFFTFYGHGSKIGFWSLFIMWFYNRFWIPKLDYYFM